MRNIDIERTGKQLKKCCKERGIKPSDIQKALSLHNPQAVYKWFRGESLPSIENLCTVADLLHLPIEALLIFQEDAASSEQNIRFMLEWAVRNAKKSDHIKICFWKAIGVLLGVCEDIR
ncbi:MAG: helix-turn-helix transcriptional regulator [Ruminococcus sp.]|nr:helix-turn-helix transcriptional regulator [Ruminococcus sp.]